MVPFLVPVRNGTKGKYSGSFFDSSTKRTRRKILWFRFWFRYETESKENGMVPFLVPFLVPFRTGIMVPFVGQHFVQFLLELTNSI